MKRKIAGFLVGAVALGGVLLSNGSASAVTWVTITCSDGFTRQVPEHAAGGITRALNAFNAHNQSGVTCSVSP
jgi:hypothetical protein